MNIGIDIRSLMEPHRSGIGEYTCNLLKNIFEIDKKNSYFLFYNSLKKSEQFIPKFECPNVKICSLKYPNKFFNLAQNFLAMPKIDKIIYNKHKIKLDSFFLPNLNFFSVSPDCKTIMTIHDLSFFIHPEFYSLKRKIWHYFTAQKELLDKIDKFICVSENTQKDLQQHYFVPNEKIKTIYSGISGHFQKLETPSFKTEQIKTKYDLPKNFILSLCTLEPRKNIEGIIQAFSLAKDKIPNNDLYLVIAGAKGWKYDKIFNLAKTGKSRYFIKFIDYVEPKDKISLYNLCDLFIFPSFYEGFGFPPLEAIACEKPVISSNSSCFPEILNNSALLCNPYKVNELSEAIVKIMTNEKLRNNLIAKGKEQVKKYTWKKAATEVLAILENAA